MKYDLNSIDFTNLPQDKQEQIQQVLDRYYKYINLPQQFIEILEDTKLTLNNISNSYSKAITSLSEQDILHTILYIQQQEVIFSINIINECLTLIDEAKGDNELLSPHCEKVIDKIYDLTVEDDIFSYGYMHNFTRDTMTKLQRLYNEVEEY